MFNVQTKKLYPDLIPKMENINELIRKISSNITSCIDPKNQDGTIMPKIVWKFKTYIEVSKQRVLDFAFSVCELWNTGNVGGAFVLLRCIYENESYLYDLYTQLKRNIENNDFQSCDELIMNRLFGVKMKDKGMPDIGNVLKMVDKLDKLSKGFREHYDILSEFTHPNYFAMAGLYCEFNENPYRHSHIDGALGFNKKNFCLIVDSLILTLTGFDLFMNDIGKLYPDLIKLSNEDEKKCKEKNK